MPVYSLPKEFEDTVPHFGGSGSYDDHLQAEQQFLARLVSWAKERITTDENIGAVVRWQVADGYAQYLVANLKPVQLIHLPLGDCWEYALAHRATKKDLLAMIAADKAWAELITRKQAEKKVEEQ